MYRVGLSVSQSVSVRVLCGEVLRVLVLLTLAYMLA